MANVKVKKTAAEAKALQSDAGSSSQRLAEFLAKNKLVLSIILIGLMAAGIFTVFYSNNLSTKRDAAAYLLDESIYILGRLPYHTNQEAFQRDQKALQDNLANLISEYPDSVPAVRGRLLFGRLMLESAQAGTGVMNESEKIINAALDNYTQAYNYAKNDYYKVLSLYGMGMSYEHKNAPNEAAQKYQEIISNFPKSPLIPTAIIALAKMKFVLKDYSASMKLCQDLVATYPDSKWSSYAKGMIYLLKSGGSAPTKASAKNENATKSPIGIDPMTTTPLTPIQ